MIQDFKQCWASSPMEEHFAPLLRKRWGLSKYVDPNQPSLFFGFYDDSDFNIIKNHKAPFIMLWGGADMSPNRVKAISNLPNSFQIGYGWQSSILDNLKISYKSIIIPIKSFDRFKPTTLGENIYVYRGWKTPRNQYFQWENMVEPLFDVFGEDRFTFGMGYNMDYTYNNLYKNCFVYLKPTDRGGSTTMWELGHMGVKTIANNQGDAPNVLSYNNIYDVIDLIQQESQKIGTIQTQLSNDVKEYMGIGPEWLTLDFWNE